MSGTFGGCNVEVRSCVNCFVDDVCCVATTNLLPIVIFGAGLTECLLRDDCCAATTNLLSIVVSGAGLAECLLCDTRCAATTNLLLTVVCGVGLIALFLLVGRSVAATNAPLIVGCDAFCIRLLSNADCCLCTFDASLWSTVHAIIIGAGRKSALRLVRAWLVLSCLFGRSCGWCPPRPRPPRPRPARPLPLPLRPLPFVLRIMRCLLLLDMFTMFASAVIALVERSPEFVVDQWTAVFQSACILRCEVGVSVAAALTISVIVVCTLSLCSLFCC